MTPAVHSFITRWGTATGSKRANYQLFLSELCVLLELPSPNPASDDTTENT